MDFGPLPPEAFVLGKGLSADPGRRQRQGSEAADRPSAGDAAQKADASQDGAVPEPVSPGRKPLWRRVIHLAGGYAKRHPVLLAVSLIVLCVSWWWCHVPKLDYLPITSSWKVEASETWSTWLSPSIYWRYRVPEASADLAAKIGPMLPAIGERLRVQSSETLREDFLHSPLQRVQMDDMEGLDWFKRDGNLAVRELPASELVKLDWPGILARHSRGRYAIRTDRPFVILWGGIWTGTCLIHTIHVRIIDMGPNQSVVEAWDEQYPDL